MGGMEYTLIAAVMRKQIHAERYGRNADNPYDLALTFALERLLPLLEGLEQESVSLWRSLAARMRTRTLSARS